LAAKQRLGTKFGKESIIAEDLGVITPEVEEMRDSLGFAGMAVLQFGFGGGDDNCYLPHNFATTNLAVYTGTHDNDTTHGWYAASPEHTRDRVRRYMGVCGQDIAWDMIRLAFSSVAATCIVPMQDVLSQPSSQRMNTPGVASGNWGYRCCPADFSKECASGLRYLAQVYNRL
jgi:4-alpha-glucanotransferase